MQINMIIIKKNGQVQQKVKKRMLIIIKVQIYVKEEKLLMAQNFHSLIIDIVLGSVCCLLGLLHYFDIGKYCLKITGIIGLATGVIGLVLTVIYLGYSSYIFNNDYSDETILYDNGAILKLVDGKN